MTSPKRKAVGSADWSTPAATPTAQTNNSSNIASLHKRFEQPKSTVTPTLPAPSSTIREKARVPQSLGVIGKQTSSSASPVQKLEIKIDNAVVDSMVNKMKDLPLPSTLPKALPKVTPVLNHNPSPVTLQTQNPLTKPISPLVTDGVHGRGLEGIKRKHAEVQESLVNAQLMLRIYEQQLKEQKEEKQKLVQQLAQTETDCAQQLQGMGYLGMIAKRHLQILVEKVQVLSPEALETILANASQDMETVENLDKESVNFKEKFATTLKRIEERQNLLMEARQRADAKERQWKKSVNAMLNQVGVSDLFDPEVLSSPSTASQVYTPKFAAALANQGKSVAPQAPPPPTDSPVKPPIEEQPSEETDIPPAPPQPPTEHQLPLFKSSISLDLSLNVPQ